MPTLPELAWRGPPFYTWRSPMDTLGVHTHVRVFHAHCGEFIRYLPPKTYILPRLRLHRDIQRPSGSECAPHNGYRLPCVAGNRYVRSSSSAAYVFSIFLACGGAAMNVPSAIAMIRMTCPDPVERSAAYAAYALAGTVGNVSGFVIGGVLTARTSWRWSTSLSHVAFN